MDRAREASGRWGPYRQASPPPARHRPGARSARREGRRHPTADRTAKETPMSRTLFASLKPRPAGTPARGTPRRPKTARLHLEALDDRTLPSTFTVTSLLDSGAGSLREA